MIDAHCHLYSDKYDHDLDAVIQRARKYLEGVVVSAVDPESLQKSLTIRRQHSDFIHVTAGVHPRTSATLTKEKLAQLWQTIKNIKEEIVAVGEVGPDFHHTRDPRLRQRQLVVLEEAMTLAESLQLPLVIHARQAEAAALEVVHIHIRVVCLTATFGDERFGHGCACVDRKSGSHSLEAGLDRERLNPNREARLNATD